MKFVIKNPVRWSVLLLFEKSSLRSRILNQMYISLSVRNIEVFCTFNLGFAATGMGWDGILENKLKWLE